MSVYYPYGMNLEGAFLGQADELGVEANMDELQRAASGDLYPSFVGAEFVAPEYRCDTEDVHRAFTIAAGGTDDLYRSFTAGNVDLMYRRAKNRGGLEPIANGVHHTYRIIQGALWFWSGFRADTKGVISVQTRVLATIVGANPIVTQLPTSTLPTAPVAGGLYKIGKVFINGTRFDRLQQLRWENKVQIQNEPADGEDAPSFVNIDEAMPELAFDTQDLTKAELLGFKGIQITSFECYLRKLKSGSISHVDSDPVHIKLSTTAGSAQFNKAGGKRNRASCKCLLARPDMTTPPFAIDLDVTIP